jgi:hypothetical protein
MQQGPRPAGIGTVCPLPITGYAGGHQWWLLTQMGRVEAKRRRCRLAASVRYAQTMSVLAASASLGTGPRIPYRSYKPRVQGVGEGTSAARQGQ